MLLRRITKHVTDQNWFAVFIDFLIVVVGILIAFQITEWNEARSKRVEERNYLERLSVDLATTSEMNADQLIKLTQMMNDLNLTLKSLRDCKLASEDQVGFVSGLYLLGRYNLPDFVAGTFEELNSTGNFQLIRNIELRGHITRVYEYSKGIHLIDRQMNDRIVPKVNYVRRYVSFNPTEHKGRPLEIDPDIIDMDFEAICSDPVFINSVSAVREVIIAVDRITKVLIVKSDDLKADIDKELGRSVKETEKNNQLPKE